jgi:hypothetical protein
MTSTAHIQEETEISLIDILIFLKASTRNVFISTAACLLLGSSYYFARPNTYEATVTIQLATVAGELVEPAPVLMEKIKLPMFFSPATQQACTVGGVWGSQGNFSDRLKPTLNKSTPFISFSARAHSSKEAETCLYAVIGEIQKSQNELFEPLIEQRKQKLALLGDQLKLIEGLPVSSRAIQAIGNVPSMQFSGPVSDMIYTHFKNSELNNLKKQINAIETELLPPQTLPTSLPVQMYVSQASVDKRPIFTFGVTLTLGVLIGVLITGVMNLLPRIRKQVREADMYQTKR